MCVFVCVPQVQDSSDVIKEGRVRVVFNIPHEPQLEMLIQNQHVRKRVCVRPCVWILQQLQLTCPISLRVSLVEVLREVQSWIRPGVPAGHQQQPGFSLLRKHLHRQRLEKEVSECVLLKRV